MSKTFFIVGASSDVGCALVKHINDIYNNTTIIAHYRSSKEKLLEITPQNQNEIILMQADLSSDVGISMLLTNLQNIEKVPDVIVHLPAPKLEFIKFKDLKWEDCLDDLNIQVESIFRILQQLLPKMVKTEGQSKVVFVLSENTVTLPAKFSTKYTMSKYMLLGLMKSLTSEYYGKRININAVSPSMIDTKLLSNIDRRMLEVSGATEKILIPEDVVPYIMNLVSSESDLMFGENVLIPGKENE